MNGVNLHQSGFLTPFWCKLLAAVGTPIQRNFTLAVCNYTKSVFLNHIGVKLLAAVWTPK